MNSHPFTAYSHLFTLLIKKGNAAAKAVQRHRFNAHALYTALGRGLPCGINGGQKCVQCIVTGIAVFRGFLINVLWLASNMARMSRYTDTRVFSAGLTCTTCAMARAKPAMRFNPTSVPCLANRRFVMLSTSAGYARTSSSPSIPSIMQTSSSSVVTFHFTHANGSSHACLPYSRSNLARISASGGNSQTLPVFVRTFCTFHSLINVTMS